MRQAEKNERLISQDKESSLLHHNEGLETHTLKSSRLVIPQEMNSSEHPSNGGEGVGGGGRIRGGRVGAREGHIQTKKVVQQMDSHDDNDDDDEEVETRFETVQRDANLSKI